MPIIYTYPKLLNPIGNELIVITDVNDKKFTKQITIAQIAGLLNFDIYLSDLKEQFLPPRDARLIETKYIVAKLKKHLKKYWQCLN